MGSLGRQLKRLESRAVGSFFDCLKRRRALLGGKDATLPKGMIRSAEWRQEMMGLELWNSRLSTNSDFSYFEISPLAIQKKRREELGDVMKRKEHEESKDKETNSDSESDYCN